MKSLTEADTKLKSALIIDLQSFSRRILMVKLQYFTSSHFERL